MSGHSIFVGMSTDTAILHWQVFAFTHRLPGLPLRARLRCLDLAGDYDWIMRGGGSPYTVRTPLDRLIVADIANLSGMLPKDLEEFLQVRSAGGLPNREH